MPNATPLVLTSQKAEITKILEQAGLVPSEFKWVESESKQRNATFLASTIAHVEGYYCGIDRSTGGTWVIERCPGATEWTGKFETGSWGNVPAFIMEWAKFVARELSAKDYLAVAMNNSKLVQLPISEDDSTPFDDGEREQLTEKVRRIEQHVAEMKQDSQEYQEEVKAQFQFLYVQLERSDRRAFYYSLIGTLVTIGATYLGTDGTRQILNFAAAEIGSIVQLLTHIAAN